MKQPTTMRRILVNLLAMSVCGFSLSPVLANDEDLSTREPVIAQCLKDRLCSCQDKGGDVYAEGLVVHCLFSGISVKAAYTYFLQHHTPTMSRLLTAQLPNRDKVVTRKDQDDASETVTIYYYTYARTGKRKIQVDYMNGSYGYTFTPKGANTALDFTYLSYN